MHGHTRTPFYSSSTLYSPWGHIQPRTDQRDVTQLGYAAARALPVARASAPAPAPTPSAAAAALPSLLPERHFRLNDMLDARDSYGNWVPAVVADLESRGAIRAGEWETDATGSWQPRGGTILRVHFRGYDSKWDEWIHAACYLPAGAAPDALGPSLRPRLAPLHTFSSHTPPRKPLFRVDEPVRVLVHQPVPEDDEAGEDVLSPSGSSADRRRFAIARAKHQPRFTAGWYDAFVVQVVGEQVRIRYQPHQEGDASFQFPQWFHPRLGEVQRRDVRAAAQQAGGKATSHAPSAASSSSDVATVDYSSVPELERDFPHMWHRHAGPSSEPHPPPASAAAAAAAAQSIPVPAARSSYMDPSLIGAVSPPLAASHASTYRAPAAFASATRPSYDAAPVVPASPSEQDGAGDAGTAWPGFAEWLRSTRSAPLRAPVGLVNMGNTCYVSAAMQILAGLQPFIQYFVLDRSHVAVLAKRKKGARFLPPPPSYSYASSFSFGRPPPPPKPDPDALPHNFGDLTMEFAHLLQQLHAGDERFLYTDRLKRLIVALPNEAGLRFRGLHMQDAHELMAVLLNAVHDELNMAPRGQAATPTSKQSDAGAATKGDAPSVSNGADVFDPSSAARSHWLAWQRSNVDVISQLFYCQSAQYVLCSRCNYASCSHTVLGQLTLDIPRTTRPSVPLERCLSTFLAADQLSDYACGRCKRRVPAVTSAYLTTLPPLLLVQLKRFHPAHSGHSLSAGKDETPVEYPERIDLAPLLQPHELVQAALAAEKTQPHTLSLGAQQASPTFSSGPGSSSAAPASAPYRLVGVVRHYDEHYTCFTEVRVPAPAPRTSTALMHAAASEADASPPAFSRAWCYFNDSKTYIEPLEDVLAHQKHVYLLVYQREQ